MSLPYFTEDAKLIYSPYPTWTGKECYEIQQILKDKDYKVLCCSRIGCDRKYHDAWEVEREDIPRLIEQLFRQRITVEVQAEGHGKASINFVYDYGAKQIIRAVSKFQKNKRSGC